MGDFFANAKRCLDTESACMRKAGNASINTLNLNA